jgi:Phd_YefM.
MIVISSREFRANQGKYLEMAANGEDIVLKSRRNGSFKLVPVTSDDTIMNKDEFYSKIERSAKQIQDGQYTAKRDDETVEQYVERLLCIE